jgi:uncharacterized GH25 family protein
MSTMTRRFTAPLVAALMSFAAAGLAHDTWLLPARFAVAPGAVVSLDLTSAMQFPAPESSVQPDRIAASGVRIGGRTRPLDVNGVGAKALELSAVLPEKGIATLWAESRPRSLTLKPDQVQEYLDEVGALEAVRARWKKMQSWRESYRKAAKTFVRVGEPGTDRSWAEPVGLALEIVPAKDPTALRAGDELPVRVLQNGKPLSGFSLYAVGAGMTKAAMRTTDQDGRATFTLTAPGPWLVKGTLLEPSSEPDTDWNGLFTTLTVSAGAAR